MPFSWILNLKMSGIPVDDVAIPVDVMMTICMQPILHKMRLLKSRRMALCMDGRLKINNKRGDVKGEYECDDPFKNGSHIVLVRKVGGNEHNRENKLHQNKGEFNPERRP